MIRLKNIRLVLAGAFIVPVALASIACSPIFADDPNGVKREIFAPELDLEALNAIIQSAVESGEISQAQVDTGIEILKREFSVTPKTRFKPFMDIEEIRAKISAAVESGEITQDEADAKLAGLEERIEKGQMLHGKRGQHHKKPFMGIEEIRAKISAAVENGEITQEEADEKLADIEAKRNARQEKMNAKVQEIRAKISAAVENGELSTVEGESKILYIDGKSKKATYY